MLRHKCDLAGSVEFLSPIFWIPFYQNIEDEGTLYESEFYGIAELQS